MKKNFLRVLTVFLLAFSLIFIPSCIVSTDEAIPGNINEQGGDEGENNPDSGNSGTDTNQGTDSGDNSGSGDSGNGGNSGSSSENLSDLWWRSSTFYHIWVKAFADSDGDGCGDFKGIENKLSYIQDTLGCDAIWLSPIFECNYKGKGEGFNMHGYDTVDYYKVNSYFGSESDLISLINACHKRGIKLIFDFVPNHTSSEHQWFKDSVNKKNGKDDWYMWSDTAKNWKPMDGSKWELNSTRNQYFYEAFGAGMPDLNYNNSEVRSEMKNVVKYWLDKGFDGLRIDAVRYLMETDSAQTDTAETHQWFKELRAEVLDTYESPKFMVCEAWVEGDRNALNAYFGDGDEFNMVFDFDAGRPCITSVKNGSDSLNSTLRANYSDSCTYGVFLGNHDEYAGRFGTTLEEDWKKIGLATALSLLRPTVPFIYYGNELGMPETSYSGDLRLRGNYDWSLEAVEDADETSPLSVNKVLISLRNAYADTFANGSVTKLTAATSGTVGYVIKGNDGDFLCVYNLSSSAIASASFSGSVLSGESQSACIIGDTDAPALTFSSNSVTVKNIAPCSFRVYKLGSDSEENIYDTETYVEGEKYGHSAKMFIRGSMNSWGATGMTGQYSGGDYIWSAGLYLEAGDVQFKFAVDGSNWLATNWGKDSGNSVKTGTDDNITYEVENAGLYVISFNESQLTWSISDYVPKYSAMYVRGSMNSWGGTAMTGKGTEDGYVWSYTMTMNASTTYSFKFATSSSNWNTNWGLSKTDASSAVLVSNGDNITFTPETTGSYTINFNEDSFVYSVE